MIPTGETPNSLRANSPIDVPFRADAGALFINAATECTVAVQPSTWGWVKQLYD